jgi:transposase
MESSRELASMDAAELRSLAATLYAQLAERDPYCYLKDVLERLPTQQASRLEELLPHHWGRKRA